MEQQEQYGGGYNDNKRGRFSEGVATYNNIRGRGRPPDRQVAICRRGRGGQQFAARGPPDRQVAICRRGRGGQQFAARGPPDRQVAFRGRGGVRPLMADTFQNGQQFGRGAAQV